MKWISHAERTSAERLLDWRHWSCSGLWAALSKQLRHLVLRQGHLTRILGGDRRLEKSWTDAIHLEERDGSLSASQGLLDDLVGQLERLAGRDLCGPHNVCRQLGEDVTYREPASVRPSLRCERRLEGRIHRLSECLAGI